MRTISKTAKMKVLRNRSVAIGGAAVAAHGGSMCPAEVDQVRDCLVRGVPGFECG